jgi:hypothetical protein
MISGALRQVCPLMCTAQEYVGQAQAATLIRSHSYNEQSCGICFDTGAYDPTALKHVADVVGVSQVVFGNDFPSDMGPGHAIAFVRGGG